MMPMRANIVGPPDVATRIKAPIAACHSWASCSAFGSFVMYSPVLERDEEAGRVTAESDRQRAVSNHR